MNFFLHQVVRFWVGIKNGHFPMETNDTGESFFIILYIKYVETISGAEVRFKESYKKESGRSIV